MDTKIISHGAIKHAEGAPCKICDRMAKAHSKSEAKRIEAVMAPIDNGSEPVEVHNSITDAPEIHPQEVQEPQGRTFSEEQVAQMLEEVQKTTTHRVLQALYAMLDQKQKDLSFPALRKFELEELEQEYENNSQGSGRE